jgi:alpha-L-rhamnosidase
MKTALISLFILFLSVGTSAQEPAAWIWYPGDFEVWLHTEVGGRRQERNQPYPPFWRVDSPYGLVRFHKTYEINKPEIIRIYSDGRYNVRVDGDIQFDFDPLNLTLPAGKHELTFLVENYLTFPSLLVQGETVRTDKTWRVTTMNQKYVTADAGDFTDELKPPSTFSLSYTPISASVIKEEPNKMLVDFGKETFGKVIVENGVGKGKIRLYYGETKQEALAQTQAETYDYLSIDRPTPANDTTPARAFRYIYAVTDLPVSFEKISALYEYLPLTQKGGFECSDPLLNRIYDVSLYTLHLNTREFHLDGIKRDRWIWSGDAYQSYLMNFYTFFDEGVNKRTLWALRGHDPVEIHINTILDYSFYWMIGIYDHFLYTGDTAFVKQIYPRMKTMMEFCLGRANQNGFVEGLPGDWVFIDWASITKTGEVSFQQLLLARSLESMALSAQLADDANYAEKCRSLSENIRKKIFETFWSDEKNALVHSRENGVLTETVTRYANMFAVLFDYADDNMKQKIRDHVILNDSILKITTPYMKFYELASLCEVGEKEKAIDFVKDYWGGMLDLGATSIWEAYDPEQTGDEHYAMYGRPFGKSLCHAWGANPVYLFGKYLLGVKPTLPGYAAYLIEPSLAGLDWIKGKVPTPDGSIEVFMNKKEIKVKTVAGKGTLRITSGKPPVAEKGVTITKTSDKQYDILLDIPMKEYSVSYSK